MNLLFMAKQNPFADALAIFDPYIDVHYQGNILTANQSTIETDLTGLVKKGGATIKRDATKAWQGGASLKIVMPVNASTYYADGVAIYYIMPFAGKPCTFSFYARGNSGGEVITTYFECYDADDNYVGGSESSNIVALSKSGWTRIWCSSPAVPASAVTVSIYIANDNSAAKTIYVDGLQLEEAAEPTEWKPGLTPPQLVTDRSGCGNHAIFGSAGAIDTNDPLWLANAIQFAELDDYIKLTQGVFSNLPQWSCITVINNYGPGGDGCGRLAYKTVWNIAANGKLVLSVDRAGQDRWESGGYSYRTNLVTMVGYDRTLPDAGPVMWINDSRQAITRLATGSGNVLSDASYDLHLGNSAAAGKNFSGLFYYQAWIPRILSNAEYLRGYSYLKSLMGRRGIEV